MARRPSISRRRTSMRTVTNRISRSVVRRLVSQSLRGEDLFATSSGRSRSEGGFSFNREVNSFENGTISAVLGALFYRPKTTQQQQQETERSQAARQRFRSS